jgi:hypothetical protein
MRYEVQDAETRCLKLCREECIIGYVHYVQKHTVSNSTEYYEQGYQLNSLEEERV